MNAVLMLRGTHALQTGRMQTDRVCSVFTAAFNSLLSWLRRVEFSYNDPLSRIRILTQSHIQRQSMTGRYHLESVQKCLIASYIWLFLSTLKTSTDKNRNNTLSSNHWTCWAAAIGLSSSSSSRVLSSSSEMVVCFSCASGKGKS